MINFKKWFESVDENSVDNSVYYRISNGIIGKGGENQSNKLGPGTYWTPRWESILMMMSTTMKYYFSNTSLSKDRNYWLTTIYKIENAVMSDAPKEHGWAFNFNVDAGEKVLVQQTKPPEIVVKNGVLLKDIHPTDEIFLKLIGQLTVNDKPLDISKMAEVNFNGQVAFLLPDYKSYCIKIYKPNPKQYWKPIFIGSITSYKEYSDLLKTNKMSYKDDSSDAIDGIEWFVMDMDKDARHGVLKAKDWLWPGYKFGQHKED